MFGHIKPEEFLDLIEGASLAEDRRTHLASCQACAGRLQAVKSVHMDLSSLAMSDMDMPEPDWNEFRSSVRTELLSRSVQRESSVRRWTGWTGWSLQPAMAWGLSLGLLFCVMAGGFLWHLSLDRQQQTRNAEAVDASAVDTQEPAIDIAADADPAAIETEKAVWTDAGVFETVAQLKDEQAEQLRRLLEAAPAETATFQRQ